MTCSISRSVLDALLAEAARSPDHEVCGLLFGAEGAITGHKSCRNVASNREQAFEIDPAQLIAAYRAERSGGGRIVGCYHSHPNGAPTPSAHDAQAEANGWIWLILGNHEAACWRAIHDGAVHGRFDSVLMEVVDGCGDGPTGPQGTAHPEPAP